jgi:hypothetical protein
MDSALPTSAASIAISAASYYLATQPPSSPPPSPPPSPSPPSTPPPTLPPPSPPPSKKQSRQSSPLPQLRHVATCVGGLGTLYYMDRHGLHSQWQHRATTLVAGSTFTGFRGRTRVGLSVASSVCSWSRHGPAAEWGGAKPRAPSHVSNLQTRFLLGQHGTTVARWRRGRGGPARDGGRCVILKMIE